MRVCVYFTGMGLIHRLLNRLSVVRGDGNRNDRLGALHRAWGYVFTDRMPGDYYEFGVYRGESLALSYRAYRPFLAWLDSERTSPEPWRRAMAADQRVHHPARFVGLDTFTGMPPNDERHLNFREGNYAAIEADAVRICAGVGLHAPQLHLIAGTFRATASQLAGMRPAAIVNLDCDLYQSAADALDAITPLIQQGTVLLCDEWQMFRARNDAGERRAVREWTERTGIRVEPWFAYHFAGQALFCHRD